MERVILLILDGWGISSPNEGNAIAIAKTPNFDRLISEFPNTTLSASGEAVGLPREEAGNTVTGHINLGAGRIVYQDLERINMSIADGSFFENPNLIGAINHAKNNNSKLHLIGLVGAAGVHSNIEHLFALCTLCKKHDFKDFFIHVITDGRDSPPSSSQIYLNQMKSVIQKNGIGQIASVMGRYWAMDRDRRWDRTEKAYLALTEGVGNFFKTPEEAVNHSYSEGKTDEFIEPSIITDTNGKPIATVSDNDSVIFFNFRIDRPRQLTAAFVMEDFNDSFLFEEFDPYLEKYTMTNISSKVTKNYQILFQRKKILQNIYFVMMTEYSKVLVQAGAHVAFEPEMILNPLGKVLSDSNLRQLRVAESEKERFVTYYFNGLNNDPFVGEERLIIPSPNVSTYDKKPEMSVYEITDKIIERLNQNQDYSLIVVNFANPDMVGHTGNIGAAVKACEAVDECLGKLVNFTLAYSGFLLLTADHGNVEEMIDFASGQIDTKHNNSPVPFIAVTKSFSGVKVDITPGILADVAPTVLYCLKIPKPSSMTGRNLLEKIPLY